jgi:hypothetical protein
MNDEIKEANLELLIGLKKYLDQANRLRTLLDRLLALASADPAVNGMQRVSATATARRQGAVRA